MRITCYWLVMMFAPDHPKRSRTLWYLSCRLLGSCFVSKRTDPPDYLLYVSRSQPEFWLIWSRQILDGRPRACSPAAVIVFQTMKMVSFYFQLILRLTGRCRVQNIRLPLCSWRVQTLECLANSPSIYRRSFLSTQVTVVVGPRSVRSIYRRNSFVRM